MQKKGLVIDIRITNRDGTEVEFDKSKIVNAITLANEEVVEEKRKMEAESKKEVWEAMNKLIEKEKLVAVTENLEEE